MRLFFVLLAVISSCWLFPGNSFPFEHPIPVSASIAPLADLVSQVGGEFVKVQLLVPNGSSPHTSEPKPSDIKALSDTRALFLVGGGLEMFAPDMVKATEKMFPVIEVNSGIEIINGSNNGASSDPGNTAGNPHIWLSLRNAQIIVRNIANALSQIDPAGSTKYRENAELYIQKLEDLDAWFRKESEKIAVKDFVTQHAAWVYFARDYGFV
ncbi:MAG: metal ABC transporter substrate-binding protein, partial [Candidatus Atribacteria bacterium]|nr:metal ABC transporter substrate-binding protein [Candidatus Atribacteria bacterium]